ncbi:FmdB family zinc ribbon protein [Raineyella fluvialis]|uniref:FmdB family transcriptional regulator n=1 Tax=Raineyella fluvialis TaxID=2662261 RepID=A0A5Q2FB57_9ACTN|nr:FmdB family zinc ribbon protein [Raineyella fluvialis]QGF24029.1 FmdB family transcriptional regulator [Raineyella fluvialis]
MPRYQYHCTSCGRDLEVRQSFSEPALTVCPTCQGDLRKVFNAVGVVFKGSGFYKTDSRSGSSASIPAGTSTSSASTTSSTESTSSTPAPATVGASAGSSD